MKVELSLHASTLKNVAGIGKGTSDPFAVVTHIATERGQAPVVLGKTEVIKNTLNPQWTSVFRFDYNLGTPMKVAVSIFDEVRKGENKAMGSAVFDVGAILGARGNVKAKRVKSGGTLFAQIRPSTGSGLLRLKLKGHKLKNVEGVFSKSDPFFELSRQVNSAGSLTWDNVFRSEPVHNDLTPDWDLATIELSTLCGGDLDVPIQVAVYDHESSGKHTAMGRFETSVNGLVEASKSGTQLNLKQNGKQVGALTVVSAQVAGTEGLEEKMAAATIASAPAASAPAPPKKATFLDYVSGGCQLNVVVAIDFTGSNGDPRKQGTLHYLSPDGAKNDYEKAISSIVQILAKYDSDQHFPVVGFGAKYNGVVNHCFQCGTSEEVHGVEGILQAYHHVFKTGLIMSSPTSFDEVIKFAAGKAQSWQAAAKSKGEQAYTILLIVSDGAVSDKDSTARVLNEVADSPLSIVIVGVGNADFTSMEFLDDSTGSKRDIAQFVQFNKHSESATDLSSVTLREIPEQLVSYYQSHGIDPLPPVEAKEAEIVVEEEQEIDLSLDFGEEEIVVEAGGTSLREAF